MTANKKKTIEIYENTPYNTFINNKLPKIQRCHKVKMFILNRNREFRYICIMNEKTRKYHQYNTEILE